MQLFVITPVSTVIGTQVILTSRHAEGLVVTAHMSLRTSGQIQPGVMLDICFFKATEAVFSRQGSCSQSFGHMSPDRGLT